MRIKKNNSRMHSSVDQLQEKRRSLGICLGASTVSIVQLEMRRHEDTKDKSKAWEKPNVVGYSLHPHEGDPKRALLAALKDLEVSSFDRTAATGRALREVVHISSVSEPEAVEHAYQFVKPPHISCPTVVSAGGETFMAYVLNQKDLISNVLTGNKCASGTGEFFLQQLRRMNVSLEEAAQWAATEKSYNVSGRCSVFCKSDCTHATNKGVPKSEVTAGLSKMMAGKILELLKKVKLENIMITGGASQNKMMVACLGREISGLIIPDEAPYFEALGAALWAMDNKIQPFPELSKLFRTDVASFDTLAPLVDFEKMVEFKTIIKGEIRSGDECILGLDVGSTTTKAVLFRNKDNARPYISPNLTGEAVLTVGSSLADVASLVCGVIAIGPFGCMPNRISEAILNDTMNSEGKLAADPENKRLRFVLADMEDLPFLAIETDGSPLTQMINSKLETFCLRAERLHEKMQMPGEGHEALAMKFGHT